MALRPEPVHPMWLRATTDIESPELTIFYRVLTAAYAHDAPGAAPPPPRSQLLVPPPIPGTKRTKDMIDWEGKRRQAESDDEADSSDEEGRRRTRRRVKGKQKMRATTVTADILRSELYEPFGQWAWTAHHAMKNIQTKIHIHASGKCSSSVRTCTIAGRPLSVLSHHWSMLDRTQLQPFCSELAVLKSSHHLRRLQGDVVPALISATHSGIDASLNMALPHPSFWMEASPDMPFILKEEVVFAYRKLHSIGVIHGNPQLRNMLVCADGRVKLIDFQASRALDALLSVGIMPATRADIDLEMRQVKFKLDYVGARQYEFDKRDRAHDIEARNIERARLRKLQYRGKYDGEIDEDEHYTGDDALHPPIPDPFWQDHWINDIDRDPRRFVAPGQTEEDLRNALRDFENVVIEKTQDYDERMLALLAGGQSSHTVTPADDENDDSLESVTIRGYSIRRRKRTDSEVSDVGGPTKTRESAEEELQRYIREANAEAAAATEYPFPSRVLAKTYSGRTIGDDEYGYDLPRATSSFSRPKDPIVHDYGAVVAPSEPLASNPYPKSSSSKSVGTSGDLPRASSSAGVAPKEVKVIDYAMQPYYGPQGYYVPHPPTETRAGIERVRHIRETNRETANQMGFGPSYPREDPYCIPPSYKRPPSDRPWFTTISLGKLKRRREVLMGHEEHGDYPHVPKRQKVEGEQEGSGEFERIESDEHIQIHCREPAHPPETPGGSSSSGRTTRRSKRPIRDPATGKLVPAPILRPPRPREFRKLPARREFWTGEREPCLSPKLGPPRLPVGRDEPRAILGAFVYPALPYFHMRKLTSEQRRVDKVLQGGTADSAPPPAEALVPPAEDGPVPGTRDEAGIVASGSATQGRRLKRPNLGELHDEIVGSSLEPADDSAPYWPPGQAAQHGVPVQPAPPVNPVRVHRPSRRAEVTILDPEARKEYIGRALGLIAIGCPPPPLPVTPRRRRHEGSHYPSILPRAAIPAPQNQSIVRSVPLPPPSPTREQPAQGSSRPSSSRRRQATPGPSRSVARGPAVVRGRSNVPTYGQGATFNTPRLPGSSPDQHRAKRRRTGGYLSSHATHGSPTPPRAPALVKQESHERMVIDVDEEERKPCVQVPPSSKSYWQSFVGWFTGSG